MAVVFPYVKNTTWADGSGGSTPDTAAKKNLIEDGIYNMHNAPCVRAFHSGAQSIANSTFVAVSFDSERFDQAGGAASTMHDLVTNNTRLTCQYAGVYALTGYSIFTANATGIRHVSIAHSVGGVIAAQETTNLGASLSVSLTVHALYAMAVTNYVELRCWQNSGGALTVLSEFMMVRVG